MRSERLRAGEGREAPVFSFPSSFAHIYIERETSVYETASGFRYSGIRQPFLTYIDVFAFSHS